MSGMQTASTVLFLIGGLRTVLLLVALGPTLIVQAILDGNVIVIITVAIIANMLLAAFLLRRGRGAIPAIIATILYFFDLLLSGSIFSWVIGALLLAAMIGGVRGALALRRGTGFSDDTYETFA
ncbi:MAG: hypothetical protein J0H88_04155 [Sphingomonadales bacterium]|nr:hypothetical protein [Sphingomonadales bacterium]